MIPLGDYMPDQPGIGKHSKVANNCVPAVGYYAPFYTPVAYTTNTLGEECLGAFAVRSSTGVPNNFAGSATYLKKVSAAAWADVSIATNYAATDRWEFAAFGNRVIATTLPNYPQSYVMGTSTLFANLTTAFKAKTVAVVRGFVMFGFINDGTEYRNRVRWSALEDPTDYTPSATTQSDYQDLFGDNDVGSVVRITGGEYATIFMERGIFRGTYTGGELIFQFDQIVSGQGCKAAGSVASFGDMTFFLGNDGFYKLSSQGLEPIGEGSINRTFLSEVYTADIDHIESTIDPARSLYIVAYPTTSGNLDKFLIYNWNTKRWTTADTGGIDALYVFLSESWTVDGSSSLIGNIDSGAYAAVPVDSPLFIGGEPNLAGVSDSGYSVTFNGAPLTATFETGETQLVPGRKALVKNIIPMIEGSGSTITAQVGYRNTPQEAVSYTDASTANSEGQCNVFNVARYQRARLSVSGGFTKAYGVDWEATQAGKY